MAEELRRRVAPLLLATAVGVLLALLAIQARVASEAPAAGIHLLRMAQLARGSVVPQMVDLPFRWDFRWPGVGGEAELELTLPAAQPRQPMALLFTRLGNQAEVWVNDRLVLALGTLKSPLHDGTKAPQLALVPAELLRADGQDKLKLRLAAQALRGGGVSELRYGPQLQIEALYARQQLWRVTAPTVYSITFALIGLMALALWARLREPLFACFSAAALLGVVRNLDRIWPDVPVPWPLWGAVVNVAYAWHLALMLLFVLLVLDWRARWLQRAFLAYLPLSLALVVATYASGQSWPWTAALWLLMPMAISLWVGVALFAVRPGPHRLTARVLAGAGGLAVPAAFYDLVFVRLGAGASSGFALTPLTMFLFTLVMCGVIVDRYVRNAADLRRMNQTLDAQVRAREQELERSYAQLREQQAAQAAQAERQRIMRDLHDGVGAQLVGLQTLLRGQQVAPDLLRSGVDAALDEMRLAVDSMQLSDGDLTTALATLRYRVRPRLEAAGLLMHWQVDEIPAVAGLTPRTAMQIQRILLEALTNVLKHAQASQIWVECTWSEPQRCLRLEITDDGVGLDPSLAHAGGQGLRNMQARATSIGARLQWLARAPSGCRVVLDWAA